MNLTFHGTTLAEVADQLRAFLHDIGDKGPELARDTDPPIDPPKTRRRGKKKPDDTEPATSSDDPPKTRRRGKKKAEEAEDEPKTSRRGSRRGKSGGAPSAGGRGSRRRGAKDAETTSPSDEAPKTRRRGKKKDDELKDDDLVKVASELAQATNPAVVTELLEEFGVGGVSELDGDARREFLTSAQALIDDEED